MTVLPFIEAEKRKARPTLNARNAVDTRFAQGVEIKTVGRMRGVWDITADERRTLGQERAEQIVSRSFEDSPRFNQSEFIKEEQQVWSTRHVDMSDCATSNDGVIEPLTIRDVVSFSSTESPFVIHDIKGTVMGGNEDHHLASDITSQFVEINVNESNPYFDTEIAFGDRKDGKDAVRYHVESWDVTRLIDAFDETLRQNRSNVVNDTTDGDIKRAVLTMTGSSDSFAPSRHKSATAGFVFDNAPAGTDSITFA